MTPTAGGVAIALMTPTACGVAGPDAYSAPSGHCPDDAYSGLGHGFLFFQSRNSFITFFPNIFRFVS